MYAQMMRLYSGHITNVAERQQKVAENSPNAIRDDLLRSCVDLWNFEKYKTQAQSLEAEVKGLQYDRG